MVIKANNRHIAWNPQPGLADGMKRAHEMFRTHKHQCAAGIAHVIPAESQCRVGLSSQCPRHGIGLIVQFAGCGEYAILRPLRDRHRPRCVVQHQGDRAGSEANAFRDGPQCHRALLLQSISLLSDHDVANHVVPFIPGAGDPAARREMTPSANWRHRRGFANNQE
jgi:hypothetical protein